jgi:hypothetical protein
LPLLGAIILCLLVGIYLITYKRFAKSGHAATIIRHSTDTPADDALKYWTADNMRDAKAADLPHVKDLDRGKKSPQHPSHKPDSRQA